MAEGLSFTEVEELSSIMTHFRRHQRSPCSSSNGSAWSWCTWRGRCCGGGVPPLMLPAVALSSDTQELLFFIWFHSLLPRPTHFQRQKHLCLFAKALFWTHPRALQAFSSCAATSTAALPESCFKIHGHVVLQSAAHATSMTASQYCTLKPPRSTSGP